MTREIVYCGPSTGEHRRRADLHILTAISTLSGVAYLTDLSALSRVPHLCVQWSASSAARISEWRRRARSRRDLMALDERELWDMRLTRGDALYEASKPFWRE